MHASRCYQSNEEVVEIEKSTMLRTDTQNLAKNVFFSVHQNTGLVFYSCAVL